MQDGKDFDVFSKYPIVDHIPESMQGKCPHSWCYFAKAFRRQFDPFQCGENLVDKLRAKTVTATIEKRFALSRIVFRFGCDDNGAFHFPDPFSCFRKSSNEIDAVGLASAAAIRR